MADQEPKPEDPLAKGLFDFFASQAEVMLAQYENINHLLGPTHDWTHPGTLCEVLLRDTLRRSIPKQFSIDKGYIFGRTTRDEREAHCPEIDILIHDTHHFRPIYRLEDFVIVQPEAVKGIIQVKRRLTPGDDGQLNKGLRNVVAAKQHWIDTLREKAKRRAANQGFFPAHPFFSAVVGFSEEIIDDSPFQADMIRWRTKHREYWEDGEQDTSIYVLPQFVGALKGRFLSATTESHLKRRWRLFDSEYNGKNLALQVLLYHLTRTLLSPSSFQSDDISQFPPFSFPHDLRHISEFEITEVRPTPA
jgi:hypothetical protein